MTDDIVTRLRRLLDDPTEDAIHDEIADAADEIERLRAERDATQQAYHEVLWQDTLKPIADVLELSLVDEDGNGIPHFKFVEQIIDGIERLREAGEWLWEAMSRHDLALECPQCQDMIQAWKEARRES